jgi:hypothetical protein
MWSSDPGSARQNLQRELDRVSAVVSKIEWLASENANLPGVG